MENQQLPLATSGPFETGKPVTFNYMRNKEKSRYFGSQFQQDIEPAGRYMVHVENPYEMPNWEIGKHTFHNPLVIQLNTGGAGGVIYDESSWKWHLYQHYGKKTGKRLSQALRKDGYDGIVTVRDDGHTAEIVDLTMF